jgi:lysophospholipase L1-like esterase
VGAGQESLIVLIPASDPRLSYFAPQPSADSGDGTFRLERFPRAAYELLNGQIGPLANLRSSSGCAVRLATDSPWVELRLERLRHHQPSACSISLEVFAADHVLAIDSPDLRERDGEVAVRFGTGLERGRGARPVALWLPSISTCAVAGVALADGAVAERAEPPPPRWLAIGDSLTQGFIVPSPCQAWVHRLSRRWNLPAWNLGVGGIRIEPAVFAPFLAERRWELVTIALGSNQSWRDSDADLAADRTAELARLALAGGHGRVAWLMPPWKPAEDGKGPPEFAGIPLDHAAGERMRRVRAAMRETLAPFAPRIEVHDDLMPHDHRLLPDGLHPMGYGSAKYADAVARAIRWGEQR